MKTKLNQLFRHPVTAILAAVLLGLIMGGIILTASGYDALAAFKIMLADAFGRPRYLAQIIVNAVPIILTGLSVSFAFKTGLFNIGAEGQFVIGALVATMIGYGVALPAGIHPVVILAAAFLAGGLYGGLAGFLKNRYGIHEVISTIMLNWIAFYFNNYIVSMPGIKVEGTLHAPKILDTAKITFFSTAWKRSDEGRAFIKDHAILGEFVRADLGWGIIIAIAAALILAYVLKNTVLGFHLRSVGLNRDASEFAGIPVRRSVLRSMFVAGGVAALGGAILVMTTTNTVSVLGAQEGYGWDGISVSLIANANPLANLFTGILFSGLNYGGTLIQSQLGAPMEIINIIIGTIVLAIAVAPLLPRLADALAKKQQQKQLGHSRPAPTDPKGGTNS